MHLTPREIDKLILHQAGVLAQKRLARGLRLNYVEATALIATHDQHAISQSNPIVNPNHVGPPPAWGSAGRVRKSSRISASNSSGVSSGPSKSGSIGVDPGGGMPPPRGGG